MHLFPMHCALSISKVPLVYCKAEDPCVENLEQLNRQRKAELVSSGKLVKLLQKQVTEKEAAIQRVKHVRDASRRKLDAKLADRDGIDPKDKLTDILDELQRTEVVSQSSRSNNRDKNNASLSNMTFQRAPKGSMDKFINALS
jgi:hypothetical protein